MRLKRLNEGEETYIITAEYFNDDNEITSKSFKCATDKELPVLYRYVYFMDKIIKKLDGIVIRGLSITLLSQCELLEDE